MLVPPPPPSPSTAPKAGQGSGPVLLAGGPPPGAVPGAAACGHRLASDPQHDGLQVCVGKETQGEGRVGCR